MRLGISAKLFLVTLGACALVIATYGIASHLFMRATFTDFMNEQDNARIDELMPRVRAAYARSGSWDEVRASRNTREAWLPLLMPNDAAPPSSGVALSDQTGSAFRVALLDTDFGLVMGNASAGPEDALHSVVVDGETVGWLAMVPFEKVLMSAEARFYAAQMRAWWLLGVSSVVLAALVSWLLSRPLLARLRGFTRGAHALAAGAYGTRLEIDASDEMGQLSRDFNQLAAALEHNERSRRSFMADISHELRTPLAVLQAEIEAMEDGIRPLSLSNVKSLSQQVGQLGQLINDLHDLTLTDVGAMSYEWTAVDLSALLNDAVRAMRQRFDSAEVKLTVSPCDTGLVITGDTRRLRQLLANLLENSLRYTSAGGQARVSCRQQGKEVTVGIEDSAPGVPADACERLFERFYRLDGSRARATGGSGLGLAISRNIVEAHSGQIHALPSSLGGLRIVMRFPLKSP